MNPWLEEIRRLVADDEELAFACGFVLYVEGKGLKHIKFLPHSPPTEPIADEETFLRTGEVFDPQNPTTKAIEEAMKGLDITQLAPGEWVVDIATTFDRCTVLDDGSSSPLSLLLDSELHPKIIHHLSGALLEECTRWVRRNSGGYVKDEVAHVEQLAGFRMTFDLADGWEVYYINAYHSEKSIAYHPDGKRKAKRTSPHFVLSNWPQESEGQFRVLSDAFLSVSGTHPVTVCLESQVPFHMYPFVHHLPSLDVCKPWFLAIRNSGFWGFKWRCIQACWDVLEKACAPVDIRKNFTLDMLPEYGSLIVLVVYMANALVNRLDDGGHANKVHDSGCVHTRRRRNIVPHSPLSYYALHSVYLPGQNKQFLPRISSLQTISRTTIVYLCATEEKERNKMFLLNLIWGTKKRARNTDDGDPWGVVERGAWQDAQPSRSNKQQRVTACVYEPVPDIFSGILPEEPRRARYPSEELDDKARDEGETVTQRISRIVHTYPVQIFRKVPNRRGLGVLWLADEVFDDDKVSVHTFADVSAPRRLFTSYTDHGRNRDKWDSTVQALLPTVEEKERLGRPQGLAQLQVWEDWETLLACLKPAEARKFVRHARKYISEHWAWLPYNTKKKLWVTGSPASERTVSRFGPEIGGPWIVFNPNTHLKPLPE